ncbi:hypothetical protein ACFRJ3_43195 [Streptomyces sp. NPDC056696]|uniref:hypothetical protein n=1 Tax=unclassified Streptomyces TaxID=2593676 RepID=UPI0036841FDB
MLDQVVAYDREAVRVAAVDVVDAGRGNVRRNLGLGAWGRVKLLISHREGSSSLVVRPWVCCIVG